jgi:hypothetical protein
VLRVTDVTLEELAARKTNGEEERKVAQKRMEDIEDALRKGEQEVHPFSTKVVDAHGKMLIAVFSDKILDNNGGEPVPRTFPSYLAAKKFLSKVPSDKKRRDGLDPHHLEYISVHTQSYVAVHGVEQSKVDVRHDNRNGNRRRFKSKHYRGERNECFVFQSKVAPQLDMPLGRGARHQRIAQACMDYAQADPKEKEATRQKKDEGIWYLEPVGVKHVDRLWPEQGKESSVRSVPSRSKDLNGGPSYLVESARRFLVTVNQYVQELLLPRVLATFPDEYDEKYRRTYLAAALDEAEERRPGFHTGHAIVWKNVVHQHMDGGDSGFCITFCTGSFQGGYLVFPDLNLVFCYRPGDVVIFRSKALYHGVTTWVPKGDISERGVTPGRVSHVLYTKRNAVDKAADRFPGWARQTNLGREPDVWRDRVEEDFPVVDPQKRTPLSKVRHRGFVCLAEKRTTEAIQVAPHLRRQLDGV